MLGMVRNFIHGVLGRMGAVAGDGMDGAGIRKKSWVVVMGW